MLNRGIRGMNRGARKRPRSIALTDKGLRAIGVQSSREVPLVDLPWRDEARDRKGALAK